MEKYARNPTGQLSVERAPAPSVYKVHIRRRSTVPQSVITPSWPSAPRPDAALSYNAPPKMHAHGTRRRTALWLACLSYASPFGRWSLRVRPAPTVLALPSLDLEARQ
eukprot:CAMPEP_0115870896 /NCGR_PEP_ID=MMETSP0287-20121206/22576_1 /TAXON_ID=412157 /ORGANISM="Chrysochromulina rotalis, Strain UIO044" /LENGTH=107 /DNA_ID=CAMNT_0003325659 /DNA_START=27 /DNA_END=347 /DNA_ORIENTATION=+